MDEPNGDERELMTIRKEIRTLLVKREGLRLEYRYWNDLHHANEDDVAFQICETIRMEGHQLNQKIGHLTREILTLWK